MKRLLSILAVLPLTLAACSSEPTPEEAEASRVETMLSEAQEKLDPSEGAKPKDDLQNVKVGDSIHLTCYSHNPCDGELKIESVTLSDKCEGTVDSYGSGPELEGGKTYLQIKADYSLKNLDGGWSMLNDPQIVNADGYTQNVEMSINCHEPDGYELWSATLDEGQKAKHFGVWIVPEDSAQALLEGAKIELPKVDDAAEINDEEDAGTASSGGSGSSAQDGAYSAPAVDSYATQSAPTFNPDSADGYGPDQMLPPFCERFPSEPSCAGGSEFDATFDPSPDSREECPTCLGDPSQDQRYWTPGQ